MYKPRSISLQCPLPQTEFERITIGHGSGGLLTNKLLDQLIFQALQQHTAHHDGAVFQLNGKVAFSTDSYVVSPVFFPGGNIGDLAVNGTVNDLAMCGAQAEMLSLSFILEEGLRIDEFWEILVSINEACKKASVRIVTGDTKVVQKGKGDKIFINTSGIGKVHSLADIRAERVNDGDVIIISGQVANHGMAIMSVREGLQFESTIETDSACLNHLVLKLLNAFGLDIHFMRDPTRGGVATVLNELIADTKMGISINEELLPIHSQVNAACELTGLDPLYVANEGIFICVVKKEIASDVLQIMHSDDLGKNARIIGEIRKDYKHDLILHSKIGGKRIVRMLPGEQLPRIC